MVGVGITRALLDHQWLTVQGTGFAATPALLGWPADHGPPVDDEPRRRPLVRACLDWTERTPHVAGRIGAAIAELDVFAPLLAPPLAARPGPYKRDLGGGRARATRAPSG